MNKRKKIFHKITVLLLFLTLLLSHSSFAQNNSFIEVARSNDGIIIYMKQDSLTLTKNISGSINAGAIIQMKMPQLVDFSKQYINSIDCINGYGKINIYNLDNTVTGRYPIDFVINGLTLPSAVAGVLCAKLTQLKLIN